MSERSTKGKTRRFWRVLTKPMSDRQWAVISLVGLLGFGLTGFIDVALGLGYSKLKAAALGIGVIYFAFLLYGRRRG